MNRSVSPFRWVLIELRRRRLFRTAALYIVSTWLVLQVADVTFPAMNIPEQAIRYVLIAALSCFPVAMVFGWFYDIGPHGIRRTAPAQSDGPVSAQPLGRSDFLILTALAVVVSAIVYNAVGNLSEAPQLPPAEARDGPPMVAVLPFTTASMGGENEFFATGIHDDLLTQLAQLQSIRVISRTSVLEYRDVTRNIREIGRALGADAILEGGVQSAGDRIRINAQLIDARTDEHLWAETFDRELSASNIFDVQTEIAHAITSSMHTSLTEQDATSLSVIPTENMAAYRAFRRAMEIFKTDNPYRNQEYLEALEEAVTLDPAFTRAWAELAGHLSYNNYWGEPVPEEIRRAEEILDVIRDLAPNSADFLIAQAFYTYYTLKDFDQAFVIISQAQEKAPSEPRILELKSWIQRRQGNFDDRNETIRLARKLDPRNSRLSYALVTNLMMTHNYDEAMQELEDHPFEGWDFSYSRSLLQLREHRDFDRWADELAALDKEFEGETNPWTLWQEYIAVRNYAAADDQLDLLRLLDESRETPRGGLSSWDAGRIVTHMLLGQDEMLEEVVAELRPELEQSRNSDGAFDEVFLYMDMALLATTEGKVEETARLIRQWRRRAAGDAADLAMSWTYACQVLGLVGAAAEAVECIRTGLVEPSNVHPFYEPYQPYYDPIREEPEFIELLEEVGSAE